MFLYFQFFLLCS